MLAEAARQFFVKHGIAPCRLVVAVSGGADSTALLLALAELRRDGFEPVCAHVNHHLRGAESGADEQFVRDLCREFDVAMHVADGTLDHAEGGIEAAARAIRYARLHAIREETGARFVATAHQKNDQAETVLMRLVTGSGIAGLRGIHPIRDDGLVRPLLDVARDDIDAFLRARNITPRFDRSNDDPRFLRNRVRALLREIGGTDNLATIADQARRLWPIVEETLDRVEDVETTPDETRFLSWPDDPWLRQALLHRHIRRLDSAARDVSAADLARLATQVGQRVTVTKNLELAGNVLRRHRRPADAFEIEFTDSAFIPQLGVTMRVGARGHGAQRIQLPDGASPHFTVRNRRRGDRFHPLGLAAPKKLKDFLIDRKVPAEERDRLPLLIWNGEIVWIAGVEVSERFKVTSPPGAVIFDVWLEDASG